MQSFLHAKQREDHGDAAPDKPDDHGHEPAPFIPEFHAFIGQPKQEVHGLIALPGPSHEGPPLGLDDPSGLLSSNHFQISSNFLNSVSTLLLLLLSPTTNSLSGWTRS